MKIPCTCGYDRNVCVDCMQDHIDSLHDNLRKLTEGMRERKRGDFTYTTMQECWDARGDMDAALIEQLLRGR